MTIGGLSNKTMTQSIPEDPHRNGSVTTKSTFCNGHHQWSPDLNPIANLWAESKRSADKHKPMNVKDLERICQEEWSKIYPNVFLNLFKKYRKRLHAVILARGVCTKY